MRLAVVLVTLAVALPALAQQPRPAPARPPQSPPAQPQPPEPPPGLFPCRTAAEICTIGIVTGNSQVAVLFTNAQPAPAPAAPPAQPSAGAKPAGRAAPAQTPPEPGIGDKPIEVLAGEAPGTPLDLAPHLGRVVMLTGVLDPKTGLSKAELVEVASPLLSFALKTMLTGDDAPDGAPAQARRAPGRR